MIRAGQVRVIDNEGAQLGVMPTLQAIAAAEEKGLDLILISPDANPPVCKIGDVGKLRYEQTKKEKLAKKNSKAGQLKEIKMTPKIGIHDFEVKAEHAREFLKKNFKVKVTVMFRGREVTHPDIGRRLIEKMVEQMQGLGKPEGSQMMEGRNMILILAP